MRTVKIRPAYLLIMVSLTLSCHVKQAGSSLASISTSTSTNSALQNAVQQYNASTNPKVAEIIALETQIEQREPTLERAMDVRGKLMLILMASIGAGCMGSLVPNTVEIILNGEKINDLDVSTLKQNSQYLPAATPGQTNFQFYLGDLSHQNYLSFTVNQQHNPIFATNGHFVFQVANDSTFTLSEAAMLSVTQSTAAYTKTDFCGSGINTLSGCGLQATITENQRYEMNSLTINVNGHTLYTNSNINHIFSANPGPESASSVGLSWADNNVQLNDSYIALMQSTQCAPN